MQPSTERTAGGRKDTSRTKAADSTRDRDARARVEALVEALEAMSERRSQQLFEGEWRSAEDTRRAFRQLQRRSWVVLLELTGLLGALLLCVVVIGMLVLLLLGTA